MAKSCTPTSPRADRPSPFPIFPGEVDVQTPMKRSRMGPRRAWVLGLVHLVIVAHIAQWLIQGRTLSPVEPSESMRFLELGEINAGIVFFAVAILSTAIFGRFFCGWGCHVVALQDLCGWMMKKVGIRPRPFRSRLLVWAPVFLAFYMFAWPTVKRAVLAPLAVRFGWEWFAPPAPFPGFTNHLMTENFWATFPGLAIAIPFFLICGFVTVYFLGAKGFCTYGCPYGGIFGPVDAIAPGRIRVNDRCEGCGHCTAVCTSNVRVHQEVRDYGMVVDPGCMKCLDCVDTCPKDALSFGFGPVAAGAKPKTTAKRKAGPTYDSTGAQDVLLAAVFLLTFFAWRRAYDAVPLLMAMGIAACVTYLAWLVGRLLRRPVVQLQRTNLKRDGRWLPAGIAAAIGIALVFALTAQSGFVRVAAARADAADRSLAVGRAEAFALSRPPLTAANAAAARAAADWYRRADSWREGGLGLAGSPVVMARRAWIALVLGDHAEAERHLRRLLARGVESETQLDLARTIRAAGRPDDGLLILEHVLAENPTNGEVLRELAATHMALGDPEAAADRLLVLLHLEPGDPITRRLLERLSAQLGDPPRITRALRGERGGN